MPDQPPDSRPPSHEFLRARGTFLYDLFDSNPFVTVVVDREARIVGFNAAKERSGHRLPRVGDTMYRDYAARHSIDMHAELLACMQEGESRSFPEMTYGDRFLSITMSPFAGGAIIVTQDVTDAKRAEKEMLALIDQLHRALGEIETLRTLLPICASCKRIRDDSGYWNGVEEYFTRRVSVSFSHTVCPECARKLYPDMYAQEEQSAGHTAPPDAS